MRIGRVFGEESNRLRKSKFFTISENGLTDNPRRTTCASSSGPAGVEFLMIGHDTIRMSLSCFFVRLAAEHGPSSKSDSYDQLQGSDPLRISEACDMYDLIYKPEPLATSASLGAFTIDPPG